MSKSLKNATLYPKQTVQVRISALKQIYPDLLWMKNASDHSHEDELLQQFFFHCDSIPFRMSHLSIRLAAQTWVVNYLKSTLQNKLNIVYTSFCPLRIGRWRRNNMSWPRRSALENFRAIQQSTHLAQFWQTAIQILRPCAHDTFRKATAFYWRWLHLRQGQRNLLYTFNAIFTSHHPQHRCRTMFSSLVLVVHVEFLDCNLTFLCTFFCVKAFIISFLDFHRAPAISQKF